MKPGLEGKLYIFWFLGKKVLGGLWGDSGGINSGHWGDSGGVNSGHWGDSGGRKSEER